MPVQAKPVKTTDVNKTTIVVGRTPPSIKEIRIQYQRKHAQIRKLAAQLKTTATEVASLYKDYKKNLFWTLHNPELVEIMATINEMHHSTSQFASQHNKQ